MDAQTAQVQQIQADADAAKQSNVVSVNQLQQQLSQTNAKLSQAAFAICSTEAKLVQKKKQLEVQAEEMARLASHLEAQALLTHEKELHHVKDRAALSEKNAQIAGLQKSLAMSQTLHRSVSVDASKSASLPGVAAHSVYSNMVFEAKQAPNGDAPSCTGEANIKACWQQPEAEAGSSTRHVKAAADFKLAQVGSMQVKQANSQP